MTKKILVVDDEEDIRKSVSQILELNGSDFPVLRLNRQFLKAT